jgi:hypothetical protein
VGIVGSPVEKDVKIKYETLLFNGSFFKESKFRGAAGPDVDEAWKSLGTDCTYLLPW